jgi:hypothetical protein
MLRLVNFNPAMRKTLREQQFQMINRLHITSQEYTLHGIFVKIRRSLKSMLKQPSKIQVVCFSSVLTGFIQKNFAIQGLDSN